MPIIEFRRECREFAEKWIGVQKEEFRRLGVEGDWDTYYTTMSYDAEAAIARELMKFAMSGQLYRGSKPVMWSVVEKTALAEAEVEYEDYTSDTVWVKFPVAEGPAELKGASVVIWTTTPWTIPGNRAISFSVQDRLRTLRGHGRASGQLGEARRQAHRRRQACSRSDEGRARESPSSAVQRCLRN